jgi:Putative SAM-dependent methyltransferase
MFCFKFSSIVLSVIVGSFSAVAFLPLRTRNIVMPTQWIDMVEKCCVLESSEFPDTAKEMADRLLLPLFTLTDVNNPTISQQPTVDALAHAITIEPYFYAGIQNYTLGIIALDQVSPSSHPKRSRKPRIAPRAKAFSVDFMPLSNTPLGRRSSGDTGPDLLLKATNLRRLSKSNSATPIVIYDLTAGWGQDSLLMALVIMHKNGKVHMVERNRVIAALLEDALRRIRLISEQLPSPNSNRENASLLSNCLSLECMDGNDFIGSARARSLPPDVIYLDPMFPVRKKSASVKKNMQILHSLLERQTAVEPNEEKFKNEEESKLLTRAYQLARDRVVIKRPLQAPPLVGAPDLKPTFQVVSSISRWDVYLKTFDEI